MNRFVYRLIHERRRLGPDQRPQNDLLALLMSAVDEETGESMDDRQLRDEIITILVAGHETTAISLTWTDTNTAETGYEVLRGTTPDGNFTVTATLAGNAVSYSDKNIVRGTTYYYRVRPVKSGQPGPESVTVSAMAR